MSVPFWAWLTTAAGFAAIALIDLVVTGRQRQALDARTAARRFLVYVGLAAVFDVIVIVTSGPYQGLEFVEEYVTESVLAIELVVAIILVFSRFKLPSIMEQKTLLFAMCVSVVIRSLIAAVEANLILLFSWLLYASCALYAFRAVLIAAERADEGDEGGDILSLMPWPARALFGHVPTSQGYHGDRLLVRMNGRMMATPIVLVIVTVGLADLLIAPDNTVPYIILSGNFFALFTARLVYGMVRGNVEVVRLIRPGIGFVLIFALLAVKLLLQALIASGVHRIGPVLVPVLDPGYTAVVIVLTAVVSVVVRMVRRR